MTQAFDDLIPLFLGEARGRIERLMALLGDVEDHPAVANQARRELHALKGASRMMRLTEISEICHRAEDLLNPPQPGSTAKMVQLMDQLSATIATLARGHEEPAGEPQAGASAAQTPAAEAAAAEACTAPRPPLAGSQEVSEVRVGTAVLDRLADRASLLRVQAVASRALVESIYELVHLAEKGVNQDSPRQTLATLATGLRQLAVQADVGQRRLYNAGERQLEALLRLQVQPLRPYLLNLARHARELAATLGREVQVKVEAGDSQLDRRIVETLEEAFLHLVRNAIDHGVENPAERRAAGKPEAGQVHIAASSEAERVHITVADDGTGIDVDRIRVVASERGLMSEAEATALSRSDTLQLLYQPGFSTRSEVSELSGRGVGLDAVAEAVRRVGGDLWITSEPGQGTTISMDVPIARRGERLLVLQVGRSEIALPANYVTSFKGLQSNMLVSDGDRRLVKAGQSLIAVFVLSEILGESDASNRLLIEGSVGGTPQALVVDGVKDEQEVLLRPLPSFSGAPAIFESMAVLANGRAVPVLAPHRLSQTAIIGAPSPVRQRPVPPPIRVLLADDSLVTREMMRRLLEDGGFSVTAVAAADDALRMLAERVFDCLVTDIEMPGMDGLQLTRHLRATAGLAHLPVVVVSTRNQPQERLAGLEAGADAYLAKQGLNAMELVSVVRRVGGQT